MLARASLIVLAVVMAAYLGVQLAEAQREHEAASILFETAGRLPPERARRAEQLIDRGGPALRWRWRFLRAVLAIRTDRRREAVRELRELAQEEPENAEVWGLLSAVARPLDPRLASRARAERLRLAPRR